MIRWCLEYVKVEIRHCNSLEHCFLKVNSIHCPQPVLHFCSVPGPASSKPRYASNSYKNYRRNSPNVTQDNDRQIIHMRDWSGFQSEQAGCGRFVVTKVALQQVLRSWLFEEREPYSLMYLLLINVYERPV